MAKDADQTDVQNLQAENRELRRQLAKLPPQGPAAGTPIHYRRPTEARCRKGELVSDGYIDEVRGMRPGEVRLHALIQYGDPPDEKNPLTHRFQTNRAYSTGGEPDTWHLASECPIQAP